MSRRPRSILIIVVLGLAGIAGYEARLAATQREQFTALRRTAAQLAENTAELQRARDTALRELDAAQRQLAALPPLAVNLPDITPARRLEMTAWLARVKELRRLFEANPGQQIPEMRFLTDQDWLRAAKHARLETDDESRRALAAVRSAAVGHFMPQLTSALRKFVQAPSADAPAIVTLAPLFDSPPEFGLLDRYVLDKTTDGRNVSQWKVQLKSPVDSDYDDRHYVSVYTDGRGYSGGSAKAPETWIENYQALSNAAYRAYLAANKGVVPKSIAEVLPYFNPPLDPALAEKLAKAARARGR